MEKRTITLRELNSKIRTVIEQNFRDTVWVVAEISEMKINARGHCYLELIEKDPGSDRPAARARATIWAFTYRLLKPYFETTTGRPLTSGLKVLLEAQVSFHELYGLSLNIRDIDPAYTLGEMALKRKEIIERLRKEGILEMNKQLPFPLVPQHIAVISSETAAGYQDFVHQLISHPARYHFDIELFPAMMQGKEAGRTIVDALESIYTREKMFDVVVLIRGGGSQADLSSFDDYRLAQHIAQFPLPVLTGIGHEKDETVADLVAFAGLKTPTAVAEFILERMTNFEEKMIFLAGTIGSRTRDILTAYRQKLLTYGWHLKETTQAHLTRQQRKTDTILRKTVYQSKALLEKEKNHLARRQESLRKETVLYTSRRKQEVANYKSALHNSTNHLLTTHAHHLELFSQSLVHLDPGKILKRGYSITRLKGKALKDAKEAEKGDILLTRLYKGTLISKVGE